MYVFSLQIVSRAQDIEALRIIECAGTPWSKADGSIAVKYWYKGVSRQLRAACAKQLVGKMENLRFNEIQVVHDVHLPCIHNNGVTVSMLSSVLDVSPTNVLWGPVSGYMLGSSKRERERATFESFERCLQYHGVHACPSIFETVAFVELATPSCLSWILDTVIHSFCALNTCTDVMAVVDLADPTTMVLGERILGKLAPNPRQYGELVDKFDGLHKIMIGRPDLCDGLRKALGDAARARSLGKNSNLSCIEVSDNALLDRSIARRLTPWVISPVHANVP